MLQPEHAAVMEIKKQTGRNHGNSKSVSLYGVTCRKFGESESKEFRAFYYKACERLICDISSAASASFEKQTVAVAC